MVINEMTSSAKVDEKIVDVSSEQVKTKRGRFEIENDGDADRLHQSEESKSSEHSEIKSLLVALTAKLDKMNKTIAGNDERLNKKIDNLDSALNVKIAAVKKDMESLVQTVDQRVEKAELESLNIWKTVNGMETLVEDIRNRHESRLDRLERLALEKDLVISGVPLEDKDDPFAILGDICGALNCKLKSGDFVTAFRLMSGKSNTRNKRSQPIVIRVQDEWVKQELLTAYFRKKHLNLTDIGFRTPARIYINERLTSANREIFNRAADAKNANIIHRFYTRRGLVIIQRDANSKPSIILSVNELELPPNTVDTGTNHRSRTFSKRHSNNKPDPLIVYGNATSGPSANMKNIVVRDMLERSEKTTMDTGNEES